MPYNKSRVTKLHKENPYCYYCNKLTILRHRRCHDLTYNDDATLEHLYDRFTYERFHQAPTDNTVLACYECNNKRSIIRNNEIQCNFKKYIPPTYIPPKDISDMINRFNMKSELIWES